MKESLIGLVGNDVSNPEHLALTENALSIEAKCSGFESRTAYIFTLLESLLRVKLCSIPAKATTF